MSDGKNKPRENGLEGDAPEREPCLSQPTNVDTEAGGPKQPATDDDGHVSKLAKAVSLTKKGLLILLVLGLLLLLLFVVIVIMATLWPQQPADDGTPRCLDSACFASSAQMLQSVNTSTDACDDFWEYACGGWIDSNPIPPWKSRWDIYEEISFATKDKLRSLINTVPYPTESTSLRWKVRHFYESCMALEYIETDREKPLKDLIRSLGGWEILRDFGTFDPLSWEFQRTLRFLHADYYVNAFFKVHVVPDSYNQDKNIIQISPAGLGLPDRSLYYERPDSKISNSYKRYLKEVVQQMGAVTSTAATFAENLFHFEKRIAEITPTRQELRNPLTKYHRKTVGYLMKVAPSVPWRELLLAIYPKSGVNEDTEIIVDSVNYLIGISRIVSQIDRAALNSYLMWRLVDAYLPYVSKSLTEVLNVYTKEMTGATASVPRWETCVTVTSRFLGYATSAMISEDTADEENSSRAEAEAIFEDIRNTLGADLMGSPWFSGELREAAMSKIHSMEIQIGLPEIMRDASHIQNYYSSMTVQRSDFFRNILYGVSFQREVEQHNLLRPTPESRWMEYLLENRISYVPAANKVVLPRHLLKRPLFDIRYQLPLMYGSFGVQLAKAILEAVDERNIFFEENGLLMNVSSSTFNQSKSMFRYQKACLTEVFLEKKLDNADFLNKTANSSVMSLAVLQQAYQTLEKRLIGKRPLLQPGMEHFSSEKIFFLAYAQTMCSATTSQQKLIDRILKFDLDNRESVKGTLMQMSEFSEAFSCSQTSGMYPSKQCGRAI